MNKKVTEYIVFSSQDYMDFIGHINLMIMDGWQPLGGVAVTMDAHYVQAMVKYEEDTPETTERINEGIV